MRKVKKFKLTSEFIVDISGVKLFRIKALIEFGNVKAGDLGGYIEKEENLSHMGNAWVSGNAQVSGDARVSGNARVSGDAQVFGDARVSGDKDYAYAHGFGSCNRTTTFFRLKDGDVGVRCGCFYGTLAQFRDNVCETHGETKKAQEYLMLADLMDFRFKN
ncbi:hypothetical protein L0M97_12910 [[Ruminococcus] torques]|uniref:hypothetical protein n=1 Tax=[Ruminococcus] torques TaxID=33039 RepID=UPI001D0615F9|nr:hypothetical protein [[Ruminococcus] torques]MCC2815645.1 hypothetical protein [Faecalicatena fissicatena]MCB7250992.1 hypothetical protein [[Ruminococcus] torques]MCG5029499.1 hypothetical protein [[Ruminococcus] torques]MCQ5275227.1 hypothetical protein [[Ruminococcus] torques]MCQ5336494.1 hypothetical protein [[Ruminococcus] torques]